MTLIKTFTEKFTRVLKELVDATSDIAKPNLHPLLKEPGLAIGYSDSVGKSVLELRSKGHAKKTPMCINGKVLPFRPVDSTRYAVITFEGNVQVERLMFPYIPDELLKPTIGISRPNVMFTNFCFCTPEYRKKYWGEIDLVPFCGDFNVPFEITHDGLLVGMNLLHGLEVNGKQHEKYIEFALVFGNNSLIPTGKAGLREIAFTAFYSLVTGKEMTAVGDFNKFLRTLEKPVKQNVLLLGSYNSKKDEEDFDKLKACLASFGFNGFMLKDSQDVPVQSNVEKCLAAIMFSCFVVVLDSQPSGHLAEIAALLQHRLRPVIIIRHKGAKPSTFFLEDTIASDNNCRIAEVSEISNTELLPHIKWAKEKTDKKTDLYNKINSWRH